MYSREFLDGFSLGAMVCDDTNGSRALSVLCDVLQDAASSHMKNLAGSERSARHTYMKRVAAQLRAHPSPTIKAEGRSAIIFDRVMTASAGTPLPNMRRGFSFSPAFRFTLHRLVRECSMITDAARTHRVKNEMEFVDRLLAKEP